MQIRPDRLISDLTELASIGKFKTGVNRPAFSEVDILARRWLGKKMTEAGLAVTVDRYGNVFGRNANVVKAVVIGSHSDTVPNGGWLDGSLGVVYGLEIARCFAESGASAIGVDAVSFQDEEGTFLALLGSRSFCGEDITPEIANAKDRAGTALRDAIDQSGLDDGPLVRLDPARHLAFFEAHIEQGPRLENDGRRIGVVTAIVGIKTFRLRFLGQADHAGTTPMAMRRDAGASALRFGATICEKLKARAGPDTVWNVGSIAFKPGASNVVPSEAELVFQVRDTSVAAMEVLEQEIRQTAQECAALFNASVEVTRTLYTRPTEINPPLARLFWQAACDLGEAPMSLPSGAGHDAMVLARHVPAAMLFVPSIGGRSHDIAEDTSKADIIFGAQVLLRAVELFVNQGGQC